MLETKNLVKVYKPKKGVPVKALDGVSLKFPDTGMVFLLGKSGSGKSTLLNVLGGLDNYNSGEIVIKEVSSKKFKQSHFDSYRNTYVGFIFQEYNILEEFTVGANIALALELQGKKATDAVINEILEQVDLQGYGSRRPNELSGGQKQRVAIARALVKNPKIIMADEPTGALDSRTGKQVFDTLKKLSQTKLVIVVSHDRDFAMGYADRIIELADGKVISDTTLCENQTEDAVGLSFDGATAKIPMGYHLTEADRDAINAYMDRLQSGGELEFTTALPKHTFAPTDPNAIVRSDTTPFKLIKSKLSFKHAFKIGGSGLKHKKFRLFMTILLSFISFGLFGLADTFGSYNHIQTATNSLQDSQLTYATLDKSIKVGSGVDAYWQSYLPIKEEDIQKVNAQTGLAFQGIVSAEEVSCYFDHVLDRTAQLNEGSYPYYFTQFYGVTEITQSELDAFGYTVTCGKLPDGTKNEIAISQHIADTFVKAGGIVTEVFDKEMGLKQEKLEIRSYEDLVGVTLNIGHENQFTVSAVINTNFNADGRYDALKNKQEGNSTEGELLQMVLAREFDSEITNSLTGMMMFGEGGIKTNLNKLSSFVRNRNHFEFNNNDNVDLWVEAATKLSLLDEQYKKNIVWLGEQKTQLGEKEILVSQNFLEQYYPVEYDEYGNSITDYSAVKEMELNLNASDYSADKRIEGDGGWRVVGYIANSYSEDGRNDVSVSYAHIVVPDALYDDFFKPYEGMYSRMLAPMPEGEKLTELVKYCYNEDTTERYPLNNPVCFELDSIDGMLEQMSKIFLYIGLAFAVFASFLLANFIATSISYKKQEIGILRAIGSRSNDVFRIFFAESFIIAIINFVLSAVAVFVVTGILNNVFREDVGILVTFLHCGVRQIALLLGVSILVAFLASFLPVKKIASKRPIDAIRNR